MRPKPSTKQQTSKSSTTYLLQLLRQLLRHLPQPLGQGARHVLSGSGCRNLAARAEGGHRSCATPFALTTADGEVVATKGGTTTNYPSPDPVTYLWSKKLTNKIILDTDIHAEVSNTSPRRRQLLPLRRFAQGRPASARDGSLRACQRLARPGSSCLRRRLQLATAGGSSLRAPSRPLRLARRICHPDDGPALLRSVLTILVHHCLHNSSNIPSVRKHLQVACHARRIEVFSRRTGDRNILRPSTPGNLQHSRRRLPELGRRHPSPGGCACPHQIHSKTIGHPHPPTVVPNFLFLVAGAASCEGPSSVMPIGFFPRRSVASSPG
jgi:hypothetical protein